MRIPILIILLTINALKLLAQDDCDCTNALALKALNDKLFGTVMERLPDPEQFYMAEWRKGSVLLVNGKIVTDEILKYNGFLDKFFVYKPITDRTVILYDDDIKEVYLTDQGTGKTSRFIRKSIKNPYAADSVDTYLELLAEGLNSLYAWRKMEYFPASNRYRPATKYYVSISDQSMLQVDPVNKNFLVLTGKMAEPLKTQLRKAGLNIKREQDFIQAVKIYNELLKTGSKNEK